MNVSTEATAGRVTGIEYPLFDADNHYYEPEDAFLRYMDPRLAHKAPRWIEMPDGGGKRLVFGDKVNRFLGADQTFSAVGRPGSLAQGEAGVVKQVRENLEPARDEFRHRDARLPVMDKQGLRSTMLFPTLAVSVEQLVADDVELTYANLHAFNRWLDEDWGFNFQNKIYGVPLISLLDPFLAVEELEFVVARGAPVVHLRLGPFNGRAPSDRLFDHFWAAVQDADVAVVFHACDDSYRYEMAKVWGWGNVNVPARYIPPLHRIISGQGRPVHDTIASLIYGKLFERFPLLRIGSIELGCQWVFELARNLETAGQGDLADAPIDVLRKHVWVAPFENEDIGALADVLGVDRILFGSDYPHTDGLADPASFLDVLGDFDGDSQRKILSENARDLVRPR